MQTTLTSAYSVGQHSSHKNPPPRESPVARTARMIRRSIRAALHAGRSVGCVTLSGRIAADVAAGRLIRTGDFLDRIGGGDLTDGQRSWFGRHVKRAFAAATGRAPLMVWARHRTTGHWIHVACYTPLDAALYAALSTYKGTRHLTAVTYTEAA